MRTTSRGPDPTNETIRALLARSGNLCAFAGCLQVVCFTGDFSTMSREEAIRRAQEKGVVAVDSVTKKTNLLVAADPESLSGKAQKARRYGIPIISEADFWAQLGLRCISN